MVTWGSVVILRGSPRHGENKNDGIIQTWTFTPFKRTIIEMYWECFLGLQSNDLLAEWCLKMGSNHRMAGLRGKWWTTKFKGYQCLWYFQTFPHIFPNHDDFLGWQEDLMTRMRPTNEAPKDVNPVKSCWTPHFFWFNLPQVGTGTILVPWLDFL